MGVTFRRNAIIVGAGASKEFGLPTGAELAHQIARIADIRFGDAGSRLISGDDRLVDTLRILSGRGDRKDRSINPYLHAAWRIRDNMPLAPSIDNFLDTHRADDLIVEFGKIAICHAIQKAEAESSLFIPRDRADAKLDFAKLKDTWLEKFFKILVAQRTFDDFLEALEQITFISFNYDRCIHQFFYSASTSYFGLDSQSQERVLSALKVIYPYGCVGDFHARNACFTNFGEIHYDNPLLDSASGIRTFTEGTDSAVLTDIRKSILEAELVMFLGFGFLQLNMDLLFQDDLFLPVRVLGTGKGLSKDSISEVELELANIFAFREDGVGGMDDANRIKIVDCRCGELFYEFQRYLTR